MKTLALAITATAIILASCSSSKYSAASEYDDVYYNPDQAARQEVAAAEVPLVSQPAVTPQDAMSAQPVAQAPVYYEGETVEGEELSDYERYWMQREADMLGETYEPEGSEALYANQYQSYDTINEVSEYGEASPPVIVNNYYMDPNDYYYSSNLRRFSDAHYGWDYYDPYYTDMYWYTGRPIHWGMSIGFGYPGWGLGFSFGYPSYYGGYYPSYGWGGYYDPWYPSYGWGGYYGGYYGWGYPSYGWGYPYYGGSYWAGYHHGYYHGYWDSKYYGRDVLYGRMDSRHYYGYSRPTNVVYGGAKGSTINDPRYRSRSGSATATEGVSREGAVRDTKTAGVTRTSRTSQGDTQVGTAGSVRTDQGNHYGNARSDNNTRDRGDINRNQNPGNRSAAPGQVKRTTAVKTTRTTPQSSVQQRSSNSNRGTYTPSYSKPRTSSTPSYNQSSSPVRSYTQPRSSSSSSFRSTAPNRSSSSYTRPNSSSRSSSSYTQPNSSSRSSSSYSRPSSSYRSSTPSRSSSSSYRSSTPSRSSSGSSVRSSSGSSGRSSGSAGRSSGGSSSRSSGSRR